MGRWHQLAVVSADRRDLPVCGLGDAVSGRHRDRIVGGGGQAWIEGETPVADRGSR